MPELFPKSPEQRFPQLSVEAINQMIRAVPRTITGDGLQVNKYGDRIVIENSPDFLYPPKQIQTFTVMSEQSDYLTCVVFNYTGNPQFYNPNLGTLLQTSGLTGTKIFVAKPQYLRQGDWTSAVTTDGTSYLYNTLGTNKRNAFASPGQAAPQAISPSYFPGAIITAFNGPTGLSAALDSGQITPIVWTDLNDAGRKWQSDTSPHKVSILSATPVPYNGQNYYSATVSIRDNTTGNWTTSSIWVIDIGNGVVTTTNYSGVFIGMEAAAATLLPLYFIQTTTVPSTVTTAPFTVPAVGTPVVIPVPSSNPFPVSGIPVPVEIYDGTTFVYGWATYLTLTTFTFNLTILVSGTIGGPMLPGANVVPVPMPVTQPTTFTFTLPPIGTSVPVSTPSTAGLQTNQTAVISDGTNSALGFLSGITATGFNFTPLSYLAGSGSGGTMGSKATINPSPTFYNPITTTASAGTTDLSTITSSNVSITGSTTITGLGTVPPGVIRNLTFTGSLTLTNSGSLLLPGNANLTTSAGDYGLFMSTGSGNWQCLEYTYAGVAPWNPTKTWTFTALETFQPTMVANTPLDGLLLKNPTAASSSNQQFSPTLHWIGQAWNTGTVASVEVDAGLHVLAVQGSGSTLLGGLAVALGTGGSLSDLFLFSVAGGFSTSTNQAAAGIIDATNGFTVNHSSSAAGNYLRGDGTKFVSSTLKTNDLVGTNTNDNATAGNIGEYISSTIAVGSAVSLTTGTTANVTSISLTAGDWDVTGTVDFAFGAKIGCELFYGSSSTSATLGPQDSAVDIQITTNAHVAPIPFVRYSLSGTTTVFLVVKAAFSGTTLSAYGTIQARRVR